MSSLAWRIKRLRAMRPKEVLFRLRQAGRMREEMRRPVSDLAQRAADLLSTLPKPAQTRMIRFFDYEVPYSGDAPDWHKDVHTGIVVPRKRWPEIDYRNTDEVGLAKNIWELNRHHFLEEWAIEKTDDAALAIMRIILDWIANNPRPLGINWASSLEPAFRMMSWQRAFETLQCPIDDVIKESVREQCDHILRFPSLFSSANNHLIGELTGLLAGSMILGEASWSRAVLDDFKRQIEWQVTSDGVDREQAIFYHDYVLGFLQRAKHYARSGDSFFDSTIEKMFEFSDWMQYAEGKYFEIGDRDDGIPPVERITPFVKKDGIGFWQEGGYAIWHAENKSACLRAGKFGYPSIAAHAHCDQLSVQLVVDGIEFFTDSGTFCYHEDDEMRRYFKGTSAHNTVRIDNKEQAEYGGPFLWSTHADATIKRIDEHTFEGTLNQHTRRVTFSDDFRVEDQLTSTSEHECELFWNLGPECSVSNIGENRVEINAGGRRIVVTFQSSLPILIAKGDGWYSRRFGEKQRIDRIEVRAQGGNWKITTAVEVIG